MTEATLPPRDPEPAGARQDRRARRDQLRHALSTRLLTTFAVMLTIATTLVFLVASYLIQHTTNQALEHELARRLESVASIGADTLGDPATGSLQMVLTGRTDAPGERARQFLIRQAERIRASSGVSDLVLFKPGPPGSPTQVEVLLLVPATTDRDRVRGRILTDGVAIADSIKEAAPRSASLYWDPVTGSATKCGYAPIKDESGAIAALVGVELPADFPVAAAEVRKRVWLLGAMSGLTVLAAAVFLVRHRVHTPIFRLVRAMQGEDGIPQRARVRWNDEIGVLTECYNAMVDRLAENDRELRDLYGRARERADYLQGYSRALVTGVPSGVVAVDPKGVITVWNPRATEIVGFPGVVGKSVAEELDVEHPLRRALEGALKGSVTDQALVVLDLPAGAPLPSTSGTTPRMRGSEPDTDKLRKLELEAAAGAAASAPVVGGARVEPGTDRMRREEVIAAAAQDARDADSDRMRRSDSDEARISGDEGTARWMGAAAPSDDPDEATARAEERQRMVELTCAPFHGEDGALLGAAALVHDRTELERFRRSASRNERLAAIGTLGAGLAHEIKNPLGAISGFAELIERKEGVDAARLAGRLRREIDELNRFLGEFLAFARDDTIRREPHDLADLLRRAVLAALQGVGADVALAEAALDGGAEPVTIAGGAKVRVTLLAQDLPPMAVDGALLRSAFVNLAKNALQAMAPRGGGELTVRATRFEDVVFVRVRDTGPGIPLDMRERVFDPLFTTRAEGTGLGLAITHKTITAHGGKISVRDAAGGGAELVIRLPVVGAAAPVVVGG